VYYGPSNHRQFRILVTSFENGNAQVRFHGEVHTGDADRVVVEFIGIDGRPDDSRPALREAAQRARTGQIAWLQPRESDWIVDGDALRGLTSGLAELSWLTGTALITPQYEVDGMLRPGNLSRPAAAWFSPSTKKPGWGRASHGRRVGQSSSIEDVQEDKELSARSFRELTGQSVP